jgi:uncharacterized membrane protein YfcA
MDDLVLRIVIFAIVGLVSGLISGLFGIGGSTVRLPIFIYLLPWVGIHHSVLMHVASATPMALVIPSGITATREQYALGNLDVAFYKTWVIGLFIGVALGAILLPYGSTEILLTLFAVYILLVGFYIAFGRVRFSSRGAPPSGGKRIGIASFVGLVAALTGTSGGTLTTPILNTCGLALEKAIAIASATGLVTGTIATIGGIITGWHARDLPSYSLGYVDLVIFIVMMPTVMISAPLGRRRRREVQRDDAAADLRRFAHSGRFGSPAAAGVLTRLASSGSRGLRPATG